jgi:hypothetical protein
MKIGLFKRILQYRLIYMAMALVATLSWSLSLRGIPVVGYWQETNPTSVSFSIAHFAAPMNEKVSVREWITELERESQITAFSSADRLYEKNALPLTRYFPVFDASSGIEQFSSYYSYLPSNALPPFRRSVYTMGLAHAQLFFLNAEALESGDARQSDWLRSTAERSGKTHRIAFVQRIPPLTAFWESIREAGINLVLTEREAYAPDALIVQKPDGYRPSPVPGWGEWEVASSSSKPVVFLLNGRDNQLTVTAKDRDGKILGTLKEDVTNLRLADRGLQEGAYVSVGSLWRYRVGGPDVKATVPAEQDISGQTPILKRFNLPPDDWRSPQYDDSSWPVGRGPLGFSDNPAARRMLRTELAADDSSPTYYFRKTFVIDDEPSQLRDLFLHVTYEDGFIAYLNGTEICRDGLNDGLADYRLLASPSEAISYRRYRINDHKEILVKGKNTLAVEVHRSHPNAPNMVFDLSLSYEK